MRSIVPSSLLLLITCLGCASEDPPSPVRAVERIEEAGCESYARCQYDWHGFDVSVVGTALSGDCSRLDVHDSALDVVLGRGRVRVDAAELERCRADLLACQTESPHCELALVGTQPEGAACVDAVECASRSCSGSPYSGTCGVCEEPYRFVVALGERCSGARDCAQTEGRTIVCASVDGEQRCTVRRDVGEGEPCASVAVRCEEGLFCGSSRLCAPPLALGAPCTDGDVCVRGAYCSGNTVDSEPGSPGTCVEVVLRGEGESCAPSSEHYVFCDQARNLACVDSVCRPRGTAGLGESCTSRYGCRGELPCVGGACTESLPIGGSCNLDSDCASSRCGASPPDFESRCLEPLPHCE